MAFGLAAATPAFSGMDGLALTSSKHQDGPFSNDVLHFDIDPGETKTGWFKVKNRTNDKVKGIRLGELQKAKNVTIELFDGDENITQDARSMNGYKFALDAGKATKFKARFKVPGGNPGIGWFLIGVDKPKVGNDEA